MSNPLPIDELNTLKENISTLFASDLPQADKEEMAEDVVLDFLIMSYMYGVEYAGESVGRNIAPNDRDAVQSVYKPVAGKNVVDRIAEYSAVGDVESIMRVVDTDMTRVFNEAELDAVYSAGGYYKKRWNTEEDDRVRSTHSYISGMVVDIDDTFMTWDGDEALAPGGFALPENNVNCRCWLDFVRE